MVKLVSPVSQKSHKELLNLQDYFYLPVASKTSISASLELSRRKLLSIRMSFPHSFTLLSYCLPALAEATIFLNKIVCSPENWSDTKLNRR